jgi:DNA repair exonuclease SbcCD ATPase subunit
VAQEKQALRDKVNKALEEKERAIAALRQQITKKTIDIQYLAGALAVFKKMKMYKIDLVLQFLNMHMKEILEKISDGVYRAEFVSQKRTADKKRTLDKIGILVYDSYKVLPIELCSGGQSTEVGLSVLLSVWKTANSISQKGVSSLWLDEVFGTLDEEIINRVFDSVIDIIKSMGTISVKIISHQELDSRLFDHFWNVSLIDGISNIRTKG